MAEVVAGIPKLHARNIPPKVTGIPLGLIALLLMVFPPVSLGGTFVVFGPDDFVRATGEPITVTRTFAVSNPDAGYTLRIDNGGLGKEFPTVSSAVVALNGAVVVKPADFNKNVTVIEKPVSLLPANNILTVQVRSQPGAGFALQIIGVDSVPAHLDLLSARIVEIPPFDSANIPGRQVALSLKVAGAPLCPSTSPFLAYGFLIDADNDATTGSTDPAFADLGIDARISAECDPTSGTLMSRAGTVTVVSDPDTSSTVIQLSTVVRLLPSVDFRWIAFAQEGTLLIRLPGTGHAAWAIFERKLP